MLMNTPRARGKKRSFPCLWTNRRQVSKQRVNHLRQHKIRDLLSLAAYGATRLLLCWSEEATSVQSGAVRNSALKGTSKKRVIELHEV